MRSYNCCLVPCYEMGIYTDISNLYVEYKPRMLMDYIHRPVSSIDHDVSETELVSETSCSIEETGRWI
jgi:hypothetical protein